MFAFANVLVPLSIALCLSVSAQYSRADFSWADTNHDGVVDSLDIDYIYDVIRPSVPYDSNCDTNHDGVVNQLDVTYELNNGFHTTYADANLDRKTDFVDFQTLLDNWDPIDFPWIPPQTWAQGNFSGDRVVDFMDFQVLLDYWNPNGWNFASTETPEPATLSLLAVGCLAMLRRRK